LLELTSLRRALENFGVWSVGLALSASLAACVYALAPVKAGAVIAVVFGWVVLPGDRKSVV
jgi:hypothetical protein